MQLSDKLTSYDLYLPQRDSQWADFQAREYVNMTAATLAIARLQFQVPFAIRPDFSGGAHLNCLAARIEKINLLFE